MSWSPSAGAPRRRRIVPIAILLGVAAVASGAWVVASSRVHREKPPLRASRTIRVEVLNGCGVGGVAERVATKLRAGGYVVERTGNAPEFGHPEDLVLARTADREAALEVARYLGSSPCLVQRNETADVDVTVIVGRPR